MIKLNIGNSLSQIQGLSQREEKALRKILSYDLDYRPSIKGHPPRTRCLIDRRGYFPTGLMPMLDRFLGTVHHSREDTRVVPKVPTSPFPFYLPVTPYVDQENAALACIGSHRGIVSAVTGFGKSVLIGLIINKLSLNTLVVVPTLSLKEQLTDSLRAWFGPKVGGTGSQIWVANVDSLPTAQKPYQDYDVLILDEFHRAASKTYQKLNNKAWGGIYYRFGVTATPTRTVKTEEMLLEAILSEIVYEVPYTTAVLSGHIVPVEAYYVDIQSDPMKGDPSNWRAVYSELIVNNEKRNSLIIELINNLQDAKKATLVLVKEVAHGQTLQDATGADFANGGEDNIRPLVKSFCEGKFQSLIGTTGVLGTGVDTRPAEYIILAAGGKSPIELQQNIGRGLRKHPGKDTCKVILFRDISNKYLLRHFKEQTKILKEVYGIKPERLEL